MPNRGAIVSSAARDAATGLISRLAAGARQSADSAPAGALENATNLKVNLLETSDENVSAIQKFLKHPLIWEDDHNCFYRANVGVRYINEMTGRGLTPVEDSMNAAVAILKAPADSQWVFHAGVAVRPKGREVHVIDYLAGDKLYPLDQWASKFRALEVGYHSPFAGSQHHGTVTNAQDWRFIESELHKTWHESSKYGVRIEAAAEEATA